MAVISGSGVESPFVVKAVDTADHNLESAAEALRAAIERMNAETPLEALQVLPVNLHYTIAGDAGDYRDYHYRDTGFILVGKRAPK